MLVGWKAIQMQHIKYRQNVRRGQQTSKPPIAEPNDWSGLTAVCIGAGPSLTAHDVAVAWSRGWKMITVNNSWAMQPDAHIHYVGDLRWFRRYADSCNSNGERWTCNREAYWSYPGLHYHFADGPHCSGYRAIQLAQFFGAVRIILLGYDCSIANGYHWHGRHRHMLNPNQGQIRRWKEQYAEFERDNPGLVINASRYTEIAAFPRSTMEDL